MGCKRGGVRYKQCIYVRNSASNVIPLRIYKTPWFPYPLYSPQLSWPLCLLNPFPLTIAVLFWSLCSPGPFYLLTLLFSWPLSSSNIHSIFLSYPGLEYFCPGRWGNLQWPPNACIPVSSWLCLYIEGPIQVGYLHFCLCRGELGSGLNFLVVAALSHQNNKRKNHRVLRGQLSGSTYTGECVKWELYLYTRKKSKIGGPYWKRVAVGVCDLWLVVEPS